MLKKLDKYPNGVYNSFEGGEQMYPEIKQIRLNNRMTQVTFAKYLNIPIKTLRNWEQNIRKPSEWTIDLIIDKALEYQKEKSIAYDENTGILSFVQIKKKVAEVAHKYNIEKVFLYGSYAKGLATESSDIDLFMISSIDDIEYFGVIEDFREALNKKIDLLSNKTIKPFSEIEKEIFNTGILIYER